MPNSTQLDQVEHRPFPMPARAWTMRQSWQRVLFAHFPVNVDKLRPFVPEQLSLQEFDGQAWLAVVPFFLTVRPRYLPSLPRVSYFPEINLRTYVEFNGKPGVWFFSCDARNPLAVILARNLFHLPYRHATMTMTQGNGTIDFQSKSQDNHGRPMRFDGSYRPEGEPFQAEAGSKEQFFCERYCLYGVHPRGRLFEIDIHHPPWALRRVTVDIRDNTLGEIVEQPLSTTNELLYSPGVDCLIWSRKWLT